MEPILDFSIDLAQKTGKLLVDYYQVQGMQVALKPDQTVVTEADQAADRLIRATIQEHFPQDGILSEEDQTTYPSGNSGVWIIDPLDGTTNFSLGLHYWGISIARVQQGIPQMAVVYFPMINELYYATKGEGAFLNGNQLVVKPYGQDNAQPFFSCCSRAHQYYHIQVKYKTRILGSAAYSLVSVARGSAILAFEVTPKVWDLCGSWLVVEEAGGVIGPFAGYSPFPLIPGKDYAAASYATLAAATPDIWRRGKEHILQKS